MHCDTLLLSYWAQNNADKIGASLIILQNTALKFN